MTDRLAQLMHAEADALEIPRPRVEEILRDGRSARRRRRSLPALGAAAAVVLVGGLVLVPGLVPERDGAGGPVSVHERAEGSFTASETEAARGALARGGAFAVGSTVYLGDSAFGVDVGDPAVRGLYYTSAGVLVRHGKDYAMDGSTPDTYSLVGTDGSIIGLDLHIGDVSPSTDPEQPYLAYARTGGPEDYEVVVLDLRTGKAAATVPVSGSLDWAGWEAPPVALSGDLVFVGLDQGMLAVDWRTGEVTTTPLPAQSYPDVNAGRYLEVGSSTSAGAGALSARVLVRDALSGDALLDLADVGDRWASLAPDGEHVLVLPYMEMDEDGRIGRLTDAVLHAVDGGATMDLPPSPSGGYGWTPDGLVFSVDDGKVTLCDPDVGTCTTEPLGLPSDSGTVRLGGMVNES